TRQRPAWTFPERWLHMTIALRPAALPRAFAFSLVLLAALVALLLASLLLAGASPSLPTGPVVWNGLIAYDSNDGIAVAKLDGSGQRILISGASNSDPVWSPDGSRLAYLSSGPGSTWQMMVVNADGSNPVSVATGTLAITSPLPSWSPD